MMVPQSGGGGRGGELSPVGQPPGPCPLLAPPWAPLWRAEGRQAVGPCQGQSGCPEVVPAPHLLPRVMRGFPLFSGERPWQMRQPADV